MLTWFSSREVNIPTNYWLQITTGIYLVRQNFTLIQHPCLSLLSPTCYSFSSSELKLCLPKEPDHPTRNLSSSKCEEINIKLSFCPWGRRGPKLLALEEKSRPLDPQALSGRLQWRKCCSNLRVQLCLGHWEARIWGMKCVLSTNWVIEDD